MKLISAYALSALIAATPAFAGPEGVWRSEKNEQGASISVRIHECGQTVCGDITQVHGSSDQSALGKQMIVGMHSDDGRNYSGGKIYAPDQNKWYIAKMQLKSANKMDVSGCVLGGLICRSQTWTREQ